ncbi:MAG: preprotein translocase subunit SecG [Myxococcota bacterium]
MQLFITILHVVLCIALILIILLQPGKDQGAIFGGGGGNRMYAPRGQQNLLGRATTAVAVLFMLTSISLAWYSTEQARDDSDVLDILNDGDDVVDDEKGFGNLAPTPADPPPAVEAPPVEADPVETTPEETAPTNDQGSEETPE